MNHHSAESASDQIVQDVLDGVTPLSEIQDIDAALEIYEQAPTFCGNEILMASHGIDNTPRDSKIRKEALAHATKLFEENPPATFPEAWAIIKKAPYGSKLRSLAIGLAALLSEKHDLTSEEATDVLEHGMSGALRNRAQLVKDREAERGQLETLTRFDDVMEIAEGAEAESETQLQALDRALELAATAAQCRAIAEIAPEGSTQRTQAISKAIILEVESQ